jgi:glycosyltransferase involved in cell wall biosynthesis
MRIAVLDYDVRPTNPIGGCHRRLVAELCDEHEFTVFAVRFDNPSPERITWVRVPCPTRPLALLYVTFHAVAPAVYLLHRLRRRTRFDVVQFVESDFSFGDISYAHFCHRGYLRRRPQQRGGQRLRRFFRWLDHVFHAAVEPWVFRRVGQVVVPSQGLAEELRREYPVVGEKLLVVPNPVDLRRMEAPPEYDRAARRAALGIKPEQVAVVFVALGHFERKGLPLLLDALSVLGDPRLSLIVVGGQADLVRAYRRRADELGLSEPAVRFVGMQQDVRQFFWSGDLFALPSAYEAFPLVVLEAAAARLPLLVTHVHGVEELVVDGGNGFVVERSVEGVARGLTRFLSLPPASRTRLGELAYSEVRRYDAESFVTAWTKLYAERDARPGVDSP